MNQGKKNSFRCFAILQIGTEGRPGEFLLIHKRGCKKTFEKEKKMIMETIDNYHYDQNIKASTEFNDNKLNWLGVKDTKNQDSRIWFLLLVFPNCNRSLAMDKLKYLAQQYQSKDGYQKSEQIRKQIDVAEQLNRLEEKYGALDGFETDYDEEDLRNQPMKQEKKENNFVQPQQQQQQQQQQSQQQQQARFIQSSVIQPQQKQSQFQNNYNQQDLIKQQLNKIGGFSELKPPNVRIVGKIDNLQQSSNQINQTNKLDPEIQNSKKGEGEQKKPEKKKKDLYDSIRAKEQMEESNKQKSADNLIGSLMVGTLIGSIASIAL